MSHYYHYQNGQACRYIPIKKDGTPYKRIPAGMAAQAGAVPSVTTLLDLFGDKGGLFRWVLRHGITAGLDIGQSLIPCHEANPFDAAMDAADAQMEKASAKGTEIHNAIERRLASGEVSDNPVVKTAQNEVETWLTGFGISDRCVEHCLIYNGEIDGIPVKVGGTVDLISTTLVADWKTVEPDERGKYRDPKWSECAQLAAYRLAGASRGICASDTLCRNVYIDRTTGAIVRIMEWREHQLEKGLRMLAHICLLTDLQDKIESATNMKG